MQVRWKEGLKHGHVRRNVRSIIRRSSSVSSTRLLRLLRGLLQMLRRPPLLLGGRRRCCGLSLPCLDYLLAFSHRLGPGRCLCLRTRESES